MEKKYLKESQEETTSFFFVKGQRFDQMSFDFFIEMTMML